MTLPEIDHVSFLVEHAQTFFAGEGRRARARLGMRGSIMVRFPTSGS